ncbi:MAG: polysaccharide deacetylase family protein [Gammaproteobacteria bacterium]|nr:polysaccharide deacetylase family protein [Gammaproteobacteria bacterium]
MAKRSRFKINIYSAKVFLNMVGLILGTSYMSYLVMKSFVVSGTLVPGFEADPIYVLDSSATRKQLESYGIGSNSYETRLNKIKIIIQSMGGVPLTLYEEEIENLSPKSRLFVIDAISLSQQTVEQIGSFVEEGGSLTFNFNSGFSDENGEHRGARFIQNITGLKQNKNNPKIEKQEGLFFTTKILSPLTPYIPNGRRLNLVIYDDIPLFESGDLEADAILTNWAKTATPTMPDGNNLTLKQAGVLWHGYHGKGRWVYFNFPSYGFYEVASNAKYFTNLMQGIIDFAYKPASVRKYPYIHSDKAVMVSEDTEYKYENLREFSQLAKKYKIKSTAFCVASLSDEKRSLTQDVAKNDYIEIASHSYSHQKIMGEEQKILDKEIIESKQLLEDIIQSPIYGFRPPREEIDITIAKTLRKAEYRYIFEKNKETIFPYFEYEAFLTIPRTGTDDYSYFIDDKWSDVNIHDNVFKEQELVSYLGGLYTLSTHTHLLSYKKNIKILESIFKTLSEKEHILKLSGNEIYELMNQYQNLVLNVEYTSDNFLISIKNGNRNVIEKFKFRLYWPGVKNIRTVTSEIIGTQFDYQHNIEKRYTDITVHNLKPQSTQLFIAPYTLHDAHKPT